FFAGSGSTGHAVMRLNQEDGGRRSFILVSSTEAHKDEPDKNICRDVCAERLRRVSEGLGGEGFAYLKARPILRHRLERELSNQSVWNAVCLAHGLPVSLLEGDLGWAVTADGTALAYPTGTKARHVELFREACEKHP